MKSKSIVERLKAEIAELKKLRLVYQITLDDLEADWTLNLAGQEKIMIQHAAKYPQQWTPQYLAERLAELKAGNKVRSSQKRSKKR